MRILALMILGLMVVGCMSPPDRALRDNVIGAYEYEFFGKGKLVFLKNGDVEAYSQKHDKESYSKEEGLAEWWVNRGKVYLRAEEWDFIIVYKINQKGNLQVWGGIDEDGKFRPQEEDDEGGFNILKRIK